MDVDEDEVGPDTPIRFFVFMTRKDAALAESFGRPLKSMELGTDYHIWYAYESQPVRDLTHRIETSDFAAGMGYKVVKLNWSSESISTSYLWGLSLQEKVFDPEKSYQRKRQFVWLQGVEQYNHSSPALSSDGYRSSPMVKDEEESMGAVYRSVLAIKKEEDSMNGIRQSSPVIKQEEDSMDEVRQSSLAIKKEEEEMDEVFRFPLVIKKEEQSST